MKLKLSNPFKSKTFGQRVLEVGKERAVHTVVEVGFGMLGVLATAVGTWAVARNSEKEKHHV